MNLEISGKVIKILPEVSGTGKNGTWVKRDFVIETVEQYPRKVCFATWGDKTDELKNLSVGESVTVNFNVESREYNERWYTDLKVWKMTKGSGQSNPVQEDLPPILEGDIPPEANEEMPF